MLLLEKISYGFDIATAITIIGAVISFIYNQKKENKKLISEEQETERVKRLMEVQNIVNLHAREFVKVWGPDSQSSLDVKKNVLRKTHITMGELYKKFMSIIAKDDLVGFRKLITYDMEKFNEAKYLVTLVDLEKSLLYRIRKIMNNETEEESNKIIDDYLKYTYPGYFDLKERILKES